MKTVVEWSVAFDLLWNNIMSGKAPGLEAYEKSLFLTQAENALIKDYLFSNSNAWKEGFDDSPRRQSDFRTLIVTKQLEQVEEFDHSEGFSIERNTLKFKCPSDILSIVNEEFCCKHCGIPKVMTVLPVSAEEYSRLMLAPYKFPSKGVIWRLISTNGDDGLSSYPIIELIGKLHEHTHVDYRIRYVRRPKPIILEDLLGDLSIEGETEAMTCELPEHLHDEILQRAVQIAKIAWIDDKGQQPQ